MNSRWWKRLWLRYLHFFREHWIIAGAITAWVLWLLLQIAIALMPLLMQLLFEAVIALIASV